MNKLQHFYGVMRQVGKVSLAAALMLGVLASVISPRPVLAQSPTLDICTQAHQSVATPLTDLGNRVYVRVDGQDTGERGGLYPNGSNTRPTAHEAAGVAISRQIRPLNAQGAPDDVNGKVVMISIGMSNTSMEFRRFAEDALRDLTLNPHLVIVNGAQGGRTSAFWTDPNSASWNEVDTRLAASRVTPAQVQVAWIKLTQPGPGDFPAKALALQNDLAVIVRNLKINYPNVRIAYISSRTRSYLVLRQGLSPEPAAYETGFAVKWLIAAQINGDAGLNYDLNRGPVVAPWLSWGPYLWIDGMNPRSDGLTWSAQDLQADCVHPSASGIIKVAAMLMNFFKTDATTGWFRGDAPDPLETCALPHQDVATPLPDLGNQVYVRVDGQNTGMRGGLYPNGSNTRPAAHLAAGIAIGRGIRPLNAQGAPDDANGKVVMISIGMSNTSLEFRQFEEDVLHDLSLNPRLELVNGAQAGRTSEYWLDPNSATWNEVDTRLATAGVTPAQVQVAWIKQAQPNSGAFPAKAQSYQNDLGVIVRNLKINYPNVRIAYISSRTRAYVVSQPALSPEPDAYENGFSVKWLIEAQINGDSSLNYDPGRGPVAAPWLSWGPYLWIDGMNPRSDGLTWSAQDLQTDCIHPSATGIAKVSTMLMNFFKSDATTGWFRGDVIRDFQVFLPLAGR